MQASDVMTRDVTVVSPESSVREAARKMDQFNVGALPVCEGRHLVGVLTDRSRIVPVGSEASRGERKMHKIRMHKIMAAAGYIAIAFAAGPAIAGDYPYCLQGRDYGYPGLCQFSSYGQCQATASGTFSYCGTNPRFAYGWQPQRRRFYQGW